jgi:transposase
MQGGAKKKALVLAPSRKLKSKVHLAPPASSKRSSKGTRKIRVHLSCMKKRLTRAKTIKSESRQKPIAEVRRILEESKLIKPKSDGKEVPESVLRDIYQDYMLLRNRVL